MQKILAKDKFNDFIEKLISKYEIIAPVKKENTKFQIINSPKEIYLEGITSVPLKKFFIPENEKILDFKKGKIKENSGEIKKRIVFGLRLCDINAMQVLDKAMFDPLYTNKRKNTVLIGIFCNKPDEFCFCKSMELTDSGYDLFFYPQKNDYIIDVKSKKGETLVKDLPKVDKEIKIPKPKNQKVLEKNDIENHYRNKIWKSDAEKCLSCSACTIYCPTCNCFDIKDTLDINLKDATRTRREMSCQLKGFSRVAGGKVFRDSRLARFKHFVYHKIVYFKKKKGRFMCVGCGRCLRACPTKIDWVNTINLLQDVKHPKRKK